MLIITYRLLKGYNLSRISLLPKCKATFLNYQINRASIILMQSIGYVPLLVDQSKLPSNTKKAAKGFRSLIIGGGFIINKLGLRKILLAFLYISFQGLYTLYKIYRLILIIVPNRVVFYQQIDLIKEKFTDLKLIVCNRFRLLESKFIKNFVLGVAIRAVSTNLKEQPADLQYTIISLVAFFIILYILTLLQIRLGPD